MGRKPVGRVAAAGVGLLALVGAAALWARSGGEPAVTPSAAVTASATPMPPTPPTPPMPSAGAGTTGSSSPAGGVPPGQAAAPRRLRIEALGIDAPVLAYTAEHAKAGRDGLTGQDCYLDGVITCVDPPTPDGVYWQVGGIAGVTYGDMPGAESAGTVYLYGHAGVDAAIFNSCPAWS
ncbi:MAG: hypothetical protein LBG60_02385, partial [Bifidobacteriaceae bacterium]|nr:hypothetical protein [Bifidobacteriaceae bacterium]